MRKPLLLLAGLAYLSGCATLPKTHDETWACFYHLTSPRYNADMRVTASNGIHHLEWGVREGREFFNISENWPYQKSDAAKVIRGCLEAYDSDTFLSK